MATIEKTRHYPTSLKEKIDTIKEKKSTTQPRFYFKDERQWQPLPDWGNFFLELGRYIAEYEDKENRLVVALALPTRNYAAALTALGIVQTKASSAELDSKKRFEELCKLPKGTAVYYYYNGKELKAILEGSEVVQNGERLKVRVQAKVANKKYGGSLTYWIDETEAFKIKIREKSSHNLPKNQKGRTVKSQDNSLLSSLIGTQQAKKYSTSSKLECALVGSKSILKQEISKTHLNISQQSGTLQDILEVRSFKTSEGQAYHSDVFSGTMSKSSKTLDDNPPEIVIFDGAKGFNKCRDNWRKSHCIILLDRTELHFQEAVDIINEDYCNRCDDFSLNPFSERPSGVEIIAYQEKY